MSTLRAQRRLRTASQIRKAAVDLAFAHGFEAVTVEMISAAAGVSPRTFFNYFPFREAAFTPPEPDLSETDIARFATSRGRLADDLLVLLAPILEALGDDRETLRKCHLLAQTAPKLLAQSNAIYQKFDSAILAALARRLGRAPDSADLQHMATLTTATIKCALANWVMRGQGDAAGAIRERLAALPGLISTLGL